MNEGERCRKARLPLSSWKWGADPACGAGLSGGNLGEGIEEGGNVLTGNQIMATGPGGDYPFPALTPSTSGSACV